MFRIDKDSQQHNDPVIVAYRQAWTTSLSDVLTRLLDTATQDDAVRIVLIRETQQLLSQDRQQNSSSYIKLKAIKQDDANYHLALGIANFYGIGCRKNDDAAEKHFIEAINKGNSNSSFLLSKLYENKAKQDEQNKEICLARSAAYLEKAIQLKNVIAQYQQIVRQHDVTQSELLTKELAKISHVSPAAELRLAHSWYEQHIATKASLDLEKLQQAKKQCAAMCRLGSPTAIFLLGRLMSLENNPNYIDYIHEAAIHYNYPAMVYMGTVLKAKQPAKALKFIRDAFVITMQATGNKVNTDQNKYLHSFMHMDPCPDHVAYYLASLSLESSKLVECFQRNPKIVFDLWSKDMASSNEHIRNQAYQIMSAVDLHQFKKDKYYDFINRIRANLFKQQLLDLHHNPELLYQQLQDQKLKYNDIDPAVLSADECHELAVMLYGVNSLAKDKQLEAYIKRLLGTHTQSDSSQILLKQIETGLISVNKSDYTNPPPRKSSFGNRENMFPIPSHIESLDSTEEMKQQNSTELCQSTP